MPFRLKDRPGWRGQVRHQGRTYVRDFPAKKEAVEWEVERRREFRERSQIQMPIGTDFLTFCNKYTDHAALRFSRKVFKEKKALCEALFKRWGRLLVDEITPEMVDGYLSEQAKKRSANAHNKDRKNLLAMWNWGRKVLGLSTNPISLIDRLPHDRGTQYTPPTKDVLSILAVATRKERVFLNCYLHTGARRSEIFRWTWIEDINFERREVRLGTRKTRDGSMEYEWLPMSDELYEELWWWWNNRPVKDSPFVFVGMGNRHYGKPFTTRRRFMKGLCERAGVREFGFHALRRYVASVLADTHKVSAKTIQRILRHKNVSTTERYIQNINRDLRGTLNLLGEKSYQEELPKDGETVKNDT